MLEPRRPLGGSVAGRRRRLREVSEHCLRLRKAAQDQVHLGEPLSEHGHVRVIEGKQSPGSRHQVLGGSQIEPGPGALGCPSEALAGPNRQSRSAHGAAHPAVLDRLLEVIAHDLVEFRRRGWIGLQPAG